MFNSVTYNSLISYECNYGYMIIGESVRRCDRSQEWTGLQPICRGKPETHCCDVCRAIPQNIVKLELRVESCYNW